LSLANTNIDGIIPYSKMKASNQTKYTVLSTFPAFFAMSQPTSPHPTDASRQASGKSHPIPFQTICWQEIAPSKHPGTSGKALWYTLQFEGLRVRFVEYSEGYLADHWCQKGHIVHCLSGMLTSEMEDGTSYNLQPGMTYIVSDNMSSHRSLCSEKVQLLIIDGDFLNRS
jgi:hypothetical protein